MLPFFTMTMNGLHLPACLERLHSVIYVVPLSSGKLLTWDRRENNDMKKVCVRQFSTKKYRQGRKERGNGWRFWGMREIFPVGKAHVKIACRLIIKTICHLSYPCAPIMEWNRHIGRKKILICMKELKREWKQSLRGQIHQKLHSQKRKIYIVYLWGGGSSNSRYSSKN